jgi:hypothetical protein
MNTASIQTLGNKLGTAALTTLVRLCPEVRTASAQQLDAACAAMRAKSKEAIDELLADAKAAPWIANAAFASAVLTIAHAGIKVMRRV